MKKYLGIALLALMLPGAASATLILSPATSACGISACLLVTGPETSQSEIDTAIAAFLDGATETYKQDVGAGSDSGSAASWYATTFANSTSDPQEATIVWDGGSFIDDAGFLLVKDGRQDPAWYLFDISSWDGMETIQLNDFWPDQGSISHVALYSGGETTPDPDPDPDPVPEPGVLGLLGLGLVGMGLVARRRRKIA